MDKSSRTTLEQELETLVDLHSLTEVLNCLEGICGLKAAHIREAWQDEKLARAWELLARTIEKAWDKARARGL